jgi:multiple sugar transport system permease protein
MTTTAHFLIWTIVFQVVIGFTLAWLINRKFKGNDLLDHADRAADDAVARRGGQLLDLPLPAADRPHQLCRRTSHRHARLLLLDARPRGLAPWSIVIVDTWMWTPFVMLICLAGLRSIPDYIYEAAEIDRASKWRQFWTITVPMVLPFLMLAVLFRGIENFKMFDMVALLTGGGPGNETLLTSIT